MPHYCAHCGAALGEREVAGKRRPACPQCQTVVFEDPKVAVAVLLEQDNKILLGRRAANAASPGRWSFPAGFVDRGEQVEAAAIREVAEETGLEIRIDGLVGVYSTPGQAVVLIAYAGTAIGGTLSPADDLTEVAYFPLTALPAPAFPHDPQILADWRRWRTRQAQTTGASPDA